MNPQEKKEENPSNSQPQSKNEQGGKLQRKLKFKTLDGNIKYLECDYDIKISELKKKLAEIYKIEPIRQRLLNKGKQFKDEETLDKLVDQDDTTIHLVFRSEADVKRMQENAQNNNQNQNQNQNQNNQNGNPFQNILNIFNSDQMRNITNNIVNQLFPNQNNNSNNNASNRNNQNSTINIGTTQYQTLNIGEALNLANSPLHPIAQPSNLSNPPPLNLNDNSNSQNTNNQNNANINNETVNKNNYSSQFPIAPCNNDKKYEAHLKNIEKELNTADELMSQEMNPRIPLPLLNTTQNVFTAISRSIRKYVIVNQNILCHLMRLAEIMEREQFISNSETRMTGNKLLDQAYKSLLHISKASNDLSNVIKSSNFNNAPNTGYIGIVCQGVGIETTSIPIGVGEINTENILAALGGVNNNSGNNNNNLNNNNSNNVSQAQGNNQVINASIPLGIVEVTVDASSLNNNNSNNINISLPNLPNNNQTTNATLPTNNTTVVNQQQENKDKTVEESKKDENKDKKVEESKLDEKKEKEQENKLKAKVDNNNLKSNNIINNDNSKKSPDTKEKTNTNSNSQNNKNINPTNKPNIPKNSQNTNPSTTNNNMNLFGNMMNQLMSPQNMNSLMGAVGSMLNQGTNQSGSGGNSQNSGGLFGNLFSNLMGAFGEESDEEEDDYTNQPKQTTQTQPKTEFTTPKDNQQQNIGSNNINTNINKNSLIKKLLDSPQLRRETKINDESKIGEKLEPNIEFAPFCNDIISNFTVQEVLNMYNLHFTALSRLRKDIQNKYFSDESKNDERIKQIIELICERFILTENEVDKLIDNKEFILEDFLNKHLKEIINLFIDNKEINKDDNDWEKTIRKLVINMVLSLINEVKEVYESGEDGAKTFIEFNITSLVENFIGQKYLALLQNYDKDIFKKFTENLFTIVKTEEIKNKCNNNENPLLSIDEIFHIASKDKETLEKEGKERNENNKFSDFYQLTSLFKN